MLVMGLYRICKYQWHQEKNNEYWSLMLCYQVKQSKIGKCNMVIWYICLKKIRNKHNKTDIGL